MPSECLTLILAFARQPRYLETRRQLCRPLGSTLPRIILTNSSGNSIGSGSGIMMLKRVGSTLSGAVCKGKKL